MIAVSELESSNLPVEFLRTLPTECPTCNHSTVITETLSILACSNPLCQGKSVRRMVSMLADLKVKGMGESKCNQFLEHFQVTNPYYILAYNPAEDGELYDGCSMEFSETIYEQIREVSEMYLWQYIKIGNLEGIQESAKDLFSNYDDLSDFYADMEDGGIPFIQELLGINANTVSVRAVRVYDTLMNAKEDLFVGLDFVTIISPDEVGDELIVCISDSAGDSYGTKEQYASLMQKKFGDKVTLTFVKSFTKDCHVLVWSGGRETGKVSTARKRIEKARATNLKNGYPEDEGVLMLFTGLEFEEYLSNL